MTESADDTAWGVPLILLNPAANRGNMDRYRKLLQQRLLTEPGEYRETTRSGEAQDLAFHAAQEGRPIVIVGGDGSVNEVVNGLLRADRQVPLGIIAAGSGNDFACNTLKLPQNPQQAIEIALHGALQKYDAGKINGRYFANAFSVGLDADIGHAAGQLKKVPFLRGAGLYYAAIIRQLLFGYHRCPHLSFCIDETHKYPEKRYVLIAISNGPTYGAGFRVNPDANAQDGLLDICTVDYIPMLQAVPLLPVIKKGQHAGLPIVNFYRARSIVLESARPVWMQIDGETSCTTQFAAEIVPQALLIRVPS